jgi:hypothetical protein
MSLRRGNHSAQTKRCPVTQWPAQSVTHSATVSISTGTRVWPEVPNNQVSIPGKILSTTAYGRPRGANAAAHPTSGEEKFATRRVVNPILTSTYSQTKERLELQSQPSVRLNSAVCNCVRQQYGTPLTDVLHCPLGSFSALRHSKRSTNKHGGHALAPQGVGDASRRRSVLVATGDEDALSVLWGINTNPRGGTDCRMLRHCTAIGCARLTDMMLKSLAKRRLVMSRNEASGLWKQRKTNEKQKERNFHSRTVQHLDISKIFYLPTDAQENCFKRILKFTLNGMVCVWCTVGSSAAVHHTHTNKDLIKYAATSPPN